MNNQQANTGVDRAVRGAVGGAVDVYRATDWAVVGATYWSVAGAVCDVEHPALQDFLREVRP